MYLYMYVRQYGDNEKLNYTEENNEINKKYQKCNTLWFCALVWFLGLINKHFPPTHKHRKILKRKNIRIIYSCIPKIKSEISTHNKKILNKPVNQNARKCNYINKNTCPLKGNCLLKNILHIPTMKSGKKNYQPRNYKGISENTLKKQYENHKRCLNIKKYKNDRKLSVEYWSLKAENSNPKVTWAVKNQFSAYNPQSKRYSLCLKRSWKHGKAKKTIY